jgi:hypothetical protein
MRVTSLLIILVLIAGIVYVAVFQWDWVMGLFQKGKRTLEGYRPAKTPNEALDQFFKAIDKRDYATAAGYCTGDYAEYLAKAHDAARAVGNEIDSVRGFLKDKGLITDKAEALLLLLDPFPRKFRPAEVKTDKKSQKTFGILHADIDLTQLLQAAPDVPRMDVKVFQCVLLAPAFRQLAVELVAEGSEEQQWKLNVPLVPAQRDAINHFINVHRTYVTALSNLVHSLRQDRYGSKQEFERDLVSRLIECK